MFRKVRCNRNSGGWLWWLVCIAEFVDVNTRFADLRLNRTDGRRLFPRHSWIFGLLAGFVLLAIVNGPTLFEPRGGVLSYAIVVVAIVALVVLKHLSQESRPLARPAPMTPAAEKRLRIVQISLLAVWLLIVAAVVLLALFDVSIVPDLYVVPFVLLGLATLCGLIGAPLAYGGLAAILEWLVFLAVGAALWLLANDPDAVHASEGAPFYRHSIAPVGMLMTMFALPFARSWVQLIMHHRFEQYREAFEPQLHQTELFDPGYTSNAQPLEILRAYFLAVMGTPFQLILIPSIVVVASPPEHLKLYAISSLIFSWMLMAMVVFHPRLNSLLGVINRLFAEGASLLVSIVVVAIAAARLIGVDYVTTVLDGAVRRAVIEFIFVLYAFSWMYDYFVERALIEKLLGVLHASHDAPAEVPYLHTSKKYPGRPQWLQPHGGTRIAVIRNSGDPNTPFHFNIFRPLELFREIAARSNTSSAARKRIQILAADIRFIRAFPAVLFFGLLIACGVALLTTPRAPHIQAEARPTPAADGFSLARAVNTDPKQDEDRSAPMYFIAASGGGTRAAVYTMIVLEALHERDMLDRVAGISSVSGGSLASAFFANRRPELLASGLSSPVWEEFRNAVAAPHIQDVLSGAFEWRLVCGKRLGVILAESFERYFSEDRSTLGSCNDLALIMNTALVGEAPSVEATTLQTKTQNSGSRVVFTNVSAFTSESANHQNPGYRPDLRFVCFGTPGVTLAQAASATANFPPVFSNIAIDRTDPPPQVLTADGKSTELEFDGSRRFWVTDGGAMDNRGMISLLLSLRAMLNDWDPSVNGRLPPIRILVADASAYSNTFRQDRGLGALGGARLNVASKLIARLIDDVRDLYAEKDEPFRDPNDENAGLIDTRFTVHDLTMPIVMRSAVGTHWMMAEWTSFSPKYWDPTLEDAPTVKLARPEIVNLMRQVFQSDPQLPDKFEAEWIPADGPGSVLEKLKKLDFDSSAP